MDSTPLATFAVGLAGAGHCLGMCGGITAALSLGGAGPAIQPAYHAGRLASYTLLGGLVGAASGSLETAAWTLWLRYLAGALLVAMGLYIADWWRGLVWLERLGALLWRPVQSATRHWLPPRLARHGFALGLCWGLMPCGLIYSALALAATRQSAADGALTMFSFGLGTLPVMLAGSLGAAHLQAALRRRGLKRLIALLLVVSGGWTLYVTGLHGPHLTQPSRGLPEEPAHHH
jgi:sulfite exporter TauE/SafE